LEAADGFQERTETGQRSERRAQIEALQVGSVPVWPARGCVQNSYARRRTGGSRIQHRVKQNWLKMYDKAGLVLRAETAINNPEEFCVRKKVLRDGGQRTEWVALRSRRGLPVPLPRGLAAGQRPLP